MQRLVVIALLFSLLLSALSCKNNAQKPFGKDPALENKRWELTELNGAVVSLPAGTEGIYITFEGAGNSFGGSAGCNQCNGMYTTGEENLIKLHKLAVTMMACPDMKLENQYLEMMDKVTNYKLSRKKQGGVFVEYLHLFIGPTEVARYKATPIR